MVKKITFYGSGMLGFALARHLGNKFLDNPEYAIFLYGRNKKIVKYISKSRSHPYHFKDVILPDNVVLTNNVKKAVRGTYLLVLTVPSNALKQVLSVSKKFIKEDTIVLNTAKGLDLKSNKHLSDVINEELNNVVSCFSGGTIAEDIIHDSYLGAEVGCENYGKALELCDLLTTDRLRVYPNDDLIGIEYAGAFKNVIAIAAGICDGLKFPQGSKTYLITQASEEAKKLAVKLGAKEHTFSSGSHSWTNDLWMSCTGNTRNRYFGELIGLGYTSKQALGKLKEEHKIAEGFYTSKSLHKISKKEKFKLPIFENVYLILYKGKDPKELMVF